MRKLSSAQPISVSTQVSGLTASLVLDESGPRRQWYSNQSNEYAPDREATSPLIITAQMELIDNSTKETSIGQLIGNAEGGTSWYTRTTVNGVVGEWTRVSSTAPSASNEAKIWQALSDTVSTVYIKKNVPPDTKIELMVHMEFSHPQMPGYTYVAEQEMLIVTNEDSDLQAPSMKLDQPNSTHYDIFLDDGVSGSKKSHIKTITATADEGGTDVTSGVFFYWWIVENGVEYPVGASGNHPCYVSGGLNGGNTLTVDVMYSDSITIKCKGKDRKSTAEEQEAADFFPDELTTDIVWKTMDLRVDTVCDNGATIQAGAFPYKRFRPLINTKNGMMDEATAKAHLLFNWKKRIETSAATSANIVSLGWGPEICVPEEELANNNNQYLRSTNVYCDVYLRGPYKNVVYNSSNNIVCTISGTTYNIICRN